MSGTGCSPAAGDPLACASIRGASKREHRRPCYGRRRGMAGSLTSVLITGATGSIGYRLARRLSEAGLHVRALVREPARAGELRIIANLSIIQEDLGSPESLRGCAEGCSLVYHLAAKLTGSDWAAFRAINIGGTGALLKEAARARRCSGSSTPAPLGSMPAAKLRTSTRISHGPGPVRHTSRPSRKQSAPSGRPQLQFLSQ